MPRLDAAVVAWRYIDGDVVAVDLRNSEYFSLSPTAEALWPLLAEGAELPALVARLLEEYDVAPEVAERDVRALVQDLAHRGITLPA